MSTAAGVLCARVVPWCMHVLQQLSDRMGCFECQLTEIAPEYYQTLAFHKSWTWVIWKFLSDPEVGPWTRMRRASREGPADKAAAKVLHRALFVSAAHASISSLFCLWVM